MNRLSWSVLFDDNSTIHIVQRVHESRDEFAGRALCAIEAKLRALKGIPRDQPVPKGTRWALWAHEGHPLSSFWSNGMGTLVEATGEMYANRTRALPGWYDIHDARIALGIKRS